MNLQDFFSPLTPFVLALALGIGIGFDSLGTWIAQRLAFPRSFRLIYWWFGVGLLVTLWFGLHFQFAFTPGAVWLTFAVLVGPTLPEYIRQKRWLEVVRDVISFPFLWLFLLLAIKPLVTLLSAPPHLWDEMAYHFISPNQLLYQTTWFWRDPPENTVFNLYAMIPRGLDTAYTLLFSMSRTYALARLLHFAFFISALFTTALYLKKWHSFFSAVIYSFFSLFLYLVVLTTATSGYIDSGVAAANLVLLFVSLEVVLTRRLGGVYLWVCLAALAIGMKYTTLGFVGAVGVSSTVVFGLRYWRQQVSWWRTRPQLKPAQIASHVAALSSLGIIFGGYWYLKNAVLSGNPIYPFLFPCWNDPTCGDNSSFFEGWALLMTRANWPIIQSELFLKSPSLYRLTVVGLTLIVGLSWLPLLQKNKEKFLKVIVPLFGLSIALEVVVNQRISGFLTRYFFHWLLLVPLILSLPFGFWEVLKQRGKIVVISLMIFGWYGYQVYQVAYPLARDNLDLARKPDFLADDLIAYSRGAMTLDQWLAGLFPLLHPVVQWCGQAGPNKTLNVTDPAVIWSSFEGLTRVYMVNCNLKYQLVAEDRDYLRVARDIRQTQAGNYLMSLDSCQDGKPSPYPDPNSYQTYFYYLNQELVCDVPEVFPHVYQL